MIAKNAHWDDGGGSLCPAAHTLTDKDGFRWDAGTLPDTRGDLSVSDEVYKCNREGSSSHWIPLNVAQL